MASIGNQDFNQNLPYSYIRFLNAVPNNSSVDIYMNGRLTVSGLKYQQFTEYYKALPGTYTIEVYLANTKGNPLVIKKFSISANEIYTVAVVSIPPDIGVTIIGDTTHTKNNSFANMRFVNLSPDSGPVNVYVDKIPVVYDLTYLEVSNYLRLTPGKHTITISTTDTNKTVVSHPQVYLRGGNYYTTYVVGLMDKVPDGIEILIPLEGASYLKF